MTTPAHPPSRPHLQFLLRRLRRLLISLWVVLTASFAMIHLIPGDPVRAAMGPLAPASAVARRKAELGLNRPLIVQYWHYVQSVFSGHLGKSLVSGLGVGQVIDERLPQTAKLAGIAFLVIIGLALPTGIAMAPLTRRHRIIDFVFTSLTGLMNAVPSFLLAVGLVFVFAVTFRIFPVAGSGGPSAYVLPVLALALGPVALLSRIARDETLKALDSDYIRTARSKRLPPYMLYLRHVLPNMLTASLTIAGLVLTGLIAGTVLVENVFAWPGLGTTIVQSITQQDYAVVQGIVLVYGTAALLVNLLVDILLSLLDRRSTIAQG
jgi:peptide/nickel transport system permease protein